MKQYKRSTLLITSKAPEKTYLFLSCVLSRRINLATLNGNNSFNTGKTKTVTLQRLVVFHISKENVGTTAIRFTNHKFSFCS